MQKPLVNYAFIDSQNLNLNVRALGWKLDFRKFRIYLREKHGVKKAYLFIGYLAEQIELYKSLQECGFIIIFKPIVKTPEGKIKGNCDAELVLQAMIDLKKFTRAVIVTGDGDFGCLIRYLTEQKKLEKLIVPNQKKYSSLLKKTAGQNISFLNNLKQKLGYRSKRKAPPADGTTEGSFRQSTS